LPVSPEDGERGSRKTHLTFSCLPVASPPLSASESEMFVLTLLKSVRGRMHCAHRVRHVGMRVLCTVPPPRACGSRSPIHDRILPRKIKERVLRSAPVLGKSLGPLLPHPSFDSLHRLVTSQMSPRTMGTQHEKVSVAYFHALRLQRQRQANRATETRPHRQDLLHPPRATARRI